MRVLHMIGSLGIGGSQAFIMNIYRKIDKAKIQFDFIIDHPEHNHYIKEIEDLGGKVFYLNTFKGNNYFSLRKEWDKFFTLHTEYKILHCHLRSYASIFIPIAKKHGLKVIIHSHSDSNGKGIKAFIKNVLQVPLRYQCDYYMACSQNAGKWLFGKKICASDKFSVINNAIDLQQYLYKKENRDKIRKKYNLDNKFVLGFIARVTEPKNPLFVIEVMKELLAYNEDSMLLFVGDGELLEKTKNKAKTLGILDSVVFTGAQTNVGELLAAMDYYILPSLWEGFGMSLIEAQASGIKCICSSAINSEAIIIKENIKQLDINLGAKIWAKEIKNTILSKRENYKVIYDRIKQKGYDISNNSLFLVNFYYNIIEKEMSKNEQE